MAVKFVVCSGAGQFNLAPTIDCFTKTFTNKEIFVQLNTKKKCSLINDDIFVIQSFADPNNNLMELLLVIDSLKMNDCRSITAVIPYFPYARQDKVHSKGTPISARVVCKVLEAVGVSRIVSFDLHSEQIQGFTSLPFFHLQMGAFFSKRIKQYFPDFGDHTWKFISADAGSVKRTKKFADLHNSKRLCTINKYRSEDQEVDHMELTGKVNGYNAVIFDDMGDTGGTLSSGYDLLKGLGANRVIAIVTHPVFSVAAKAQECLDKITIFTTNTCSHEYTPKKTTIFGVENLLLMIMHNLTKGLPLDDIESGVY
jgi:ribose-phosphate pyrophosphokinase